VDVARIVTYAAAFLLADKAGQAGTIPWPLVLTGILAAFAGVMIGRRFLHKVTMKAVQILTGVFLLGIALALGAGII